MERSSVSEPITAMLRPWAAVTVVGSVSLGVPNSCSNRSSGSVVCWGRKLKMLLFWLLMITIVRSM